MRRPWLPISFILLGLLFVGFAARADEPDRELARTRFKAGQALFQRGRTADALAEFEEGRKSFPLPEFDYNIGLCLTKLDRPDEAADALQRYMDAKPDDPEAAGIWRMIAELRAEAGRRHQRELAPSPPPIAAAPSSITPPTITPPSGPPSSAAEGPQHRRRLQTGLAIASVVIGGGLLLAAVLTGVDALDEKSNYDSSCFSFQGCKDSRYVEAHRLANATDSMIVIGGALVVTSIVLFAARPKLPRRVAWGIAF